MAKLMDLSGQRFGKLTVIGRAEDHASKNGNTRTAWLCKCDCGNETIVMGLNLTRGHTISCGCARKDGRKKLTHDITGQRFGKLTAIRKTESRNGQTYWLFRCDCGNEKEMYLQNVKSGKSTSCGMCKSFSSGHQKTNSIKGIKKDLTGQRFDKLIARERFIDGDMVKYRCVCDCGNECVKTTYSLIYNTKYTGTNSCGCLQKSTIRRSSLIGRRFNHLLVVEKAYSKYHKLHWLCKCDCGNMTIVSSSGLLSHHTQSCGCFQDIVASETHYEDLSGQRFGMLVALNRVENTMRGEVQYLCRCDCGTEKVIRGVHLKIGAIQSCGCSVQPLGELAIVEILCLLGLNYETQVKFDDLTGLGNKQLSYDFGLFDDNELIGLIEYQGVQHYKPIGYFGGEDQFERQQFHDDLKREYAQKYLGVPLLEIPYFVRTSEEIKSMISSFVENLPN